MKSVDDLYAVIAFFEERRGRLYGFRWRDHADWKSCAPGGTISARDQVIGTGDHDDRFSVEEDIWRRARAGHARSRSRCSGPWSSRLPGWPSRRVRIVLDPTRRGWPAPCSGYSGGGAGGDGRLRVRRAGALRQRQARDQSAGLPPRRHSQHPGRRGAAMKTLPAALDAHLATGATTLCWCWRLTRRDGIRFGFTDHDRDVVFDGTVRGRRRGSRRARSRTRSGSASITLR